jgi:deoxyhypusine synthase
MADQQAAAAAPAVASQAVLFMAGDMPDDAVTVQGYDFNKGVNYEELMASYMRTGFQVCKMTNEKD